MLEKKLKTSGVSEKKESSPLDFFKALSEDPQRALSIAIKNLDPKGVKRALEKGADLNGASEWTYQGQGHLRQAICFKQNKTIQFLCEMGVNVNLKTPQGLYPLNLVLGSNEMASKILIDHGAVISIDNKLQLMPIGLGLSVDFMRIFGAFTKKRKQNRYPFRVTIIEEQNLDECFKVLAEQLPDVLKGHTHLDEILLIRTKDIMSHWYSAKIEINEKEVKALLMDSLGSLELDQCKYQNDFIQVLWSRFKDHNHRIYLDEESRQNDPYTCSAFALEDAINMHKIAQYLPKEAQGNIFKYCDAHQIRTQALGRNRQLIYTQLPLKMMQGMQSRRLKSNVILSRGQQEQQLAINKLGQTALESYENAFVPKEVNDGTIVQFSEKHSGVFNYRMANKLIKMLKRSVVFLKTHSQQAIKAQQAQFDLNGLKGRLSTKPKR